MDAPNSLQQLSLQLDLLKRSSDLAPLNQSQLLRLHAFQDRLLDLMEAEMAPVQKISQNSPSVTLPEPTFQDPGPKPFAERSPAIAAPSPMAAPTAVAAPAAANASSVPFKTVGTAHLSELLQSLLNPIVGRALSFDELSMGVKRILTDTDGLSSQRPPPGTVLELGGVLSDLGLDPGALAPESNPGPGPSGSETRVEVQAGETIQQVVTRAFEKARHRKPTEAEQNAAIAAIARLNPAINVHRLEKGQQLEVNRRSLNVRLM